MYRGVSYPSPAARSLVWEVCRPTAHGEQVTFRNPPWHPAQGRSGPTGAQRPCLAGCPHTATWWSPPELRKIPGTWSTCGFSRPRCGLSRGFSRAWAPDQMVPSPSASSCVGHCHPGAVGKNSGDCGTHGLEMPRPPTEKPHRGEATAPEDSLPLHAAVPSPVDGGWASLRLG